MTMAKRLVIQCLADKNGVFQHYVEVKKGAYKTYCSNEVKVCRKRMIEVPLTQELTCNVCNQRRKDFLSFWKSQAELHPEESEGIIASIGEGTDDASKRKST